MRTLALKVIHSLNDKQSVRRVDVVERLRADWSRYSVEEIDDIIGRLHRARLIRSLQGPYSKISVR